MKFVNVISALLACLLFLAPAVSLAAGKGEIAMKKRLDDVGASMPRRVGSMAGGRHYCGIEINLFVKQYQTHIEFTQQDPSRDWKRMIKAAEETIDVLRKASAPCDDAFKSYLERLAY